jgi:hypothetical protein
MSNFKIKTWVGGDETRCVQAVFRMIVSGLLGSDPGKDFADRQTGYVEGRGTWPFRTMLAFADLGLSVINHEIFNFEKFAVDPEGAIAEQVQDREVLDLILQETDMLAEVDAVRKCLRSPRIKLISGIPSIRDLQSQIDLGRLLMCNVDLRVLEARVERAGHMLLVENIDDKVVTAHDPGPSGRLSKAFELDLFVRAWHSPSVAMANYIAVWR